MSDTISGRTTDINAQLAIKLQLRCEKRENLKRDILIKNQDFLLWNFLCTSRSCLSVT